MRLPSPILLSKVASDVLEHYKSQSTIYFHWPFCKNLCTYCSFNKYVKSEKKFGSNFDVLMKNSLLKETETSLKISGVRTVNSVYFGGGTPSLAPSGTISSLVQNIKNLCDLTAKAEISVECNPSSFNMLGLLNEYANCGVNRVSIGLQSLNNATLKVLGRDHNVEDGLALLKQAQDVFGNDSVTLDLLFGKPGDTEESWLEELHQILDFTPSHISLYELTPERGTKLFKQLQSGEIKLPDKEITASMYQTAIDLLKQHGLERYEVSSFARKPEVQSAHNSSYWKGSQYIGIGPGAHSRFHVFEHLFREARSQCLDPRLWREKVEKDGCGTQTRRKQNKLEVLSELLVTSMRTKRGVLQTRWSIFEAKASLRDVFGSAPSVDRLCQDGFLQWDADGSLRATDLGLNVVDAILPTMISVLNDYFLSEQQ